MASTSSIDVSHDAVLGKVRPPRKGLLSMSREAAASRLIEQLSWKVVTVEAPLGAGKTSFLADVHHRLFERRDKWRVAWLTVDERDDAERIFHHVLLAWKKELPAIDIDEFMLLHRRSADLFAVSFGNFLTQELDGSPVDYVLIVDDIDKADSRAMAEFFDCVTEYCPENFHVVASGSCALWESLGVRFRSEVYRYPQANLQLDREMIRGILSNSVATRTVQEESPSPAVLDRLAESLLDLTQGWALGVGMYADAISQGTVQPTPFADERILGQMLNRFFNGDVLAPLTDELQRFALQTALVDSMCADLCNELTGADNSKYLLRDLCMRGLFVEACAGKPGWYRYHPLFHRWLRRKQHQMDTAAFNRLCRTASTWYEERRIYPEAAKYMLMSSDADFIENMASIMGCAPTRSGVSYVDWVFDIPAERIEEVPHLALQAAWGYVCCGNTFLAQHWVDVFESNAKALEEADFNASTAVDLVCNKNLEMQCFYEEALKTGEAYLSAYEEKLLIQQRSLLLHSLAESCMRLNQSDKALKYYLQAEVMAELSGSDFFVAFCRVGVAKIRFERALFKEAESLLDKSLRECPKTITPYGLLLALKGYACIQTGRLAEAEKCIERARAILGATRNIDMLYELEAIRAQYLMASGQGDLAFRVITKTALEVGDRSIPRAVHLLVDAVSVRVALRMGYMREASRALEHLRKGVNPCDASYLIEAEELSFALEDAMAASADTGSGADAGVDAGSGTGSSAAVLPMIEQAHAQGYTLSELRLCIRAAVRFAREGNRTDALHYMVHALNLQKGQRIVEAFIEAGGQVRSILHEIADVRNSGGETRKLVKSVLRGFDDTVDEDAEAAPSSAVLFGLTKRECEVLDLLNAGLSRREIAEALVVSQNTVKSHISSIYAKLGTTNRIDAFSVTYEKGKAGRSKP